MSGWCSLVRLVPGIPHTPCIHRWEERRRVTSRHTWTTASSGRAGKSASWVTTGTSRLIAVAAIQESLTGIRRPLSRRSNLRRAQLAATPSSTGTGPSANTVVSVDSRRSRVAVSPAARTPARSSPTVMTETASWSGRASTSNRRFASRAMKMDVSAKPRVVTAAGRRLSRRRRWPRGRR